ncbi:hypothetical protein KO02_17550 [Sphingobacterium sp. ML3W]|uniref:hypothetical protein n=1 Tax=Sphingobacterium sp. ML3W TaxID=1538644 RepID=UPI0004F83188|nr:hypothetical protein [Sphingobacterium sp. ML3W]AIM38288.1 hypothetical protein KO02_17550 [Sphingobacterium sp. ML3W]
MKKMIFIDNDQERDVKEDETSHVKRQLRYHFDIDYKDLQIIREFYFKCKEEGDDKQYEMLFNSKNVIVTYSMYTSSHYGSLFTFNHFLRVAGRNGVKNMTYVNVSSEDYMIKALEYHRDEKFFLNILKAVAMNNLISYNYDLKSLTKVIVDLTSGHNYFKVIPITIEEFNIMLDK